ncbi:Transposase IS1 family [Tenacibaculum litoreum]|uniref:IS1 family transposase n=1 Tax=Tenacibaculum litoreum TaxID=321269 RepID=UPI003895D1C8
MNCTKCNSSNSIRKGLQNNKQRFYCKNCKKYFQSDYRYQAYKSETNDFIKKLLKEGCGIRSISRILNISTKTVLSRMLNISKQIKAPYFNKFGCKFEIDELFIKIANDKKQNWLIYAIEQKTKNVIDFIIGSRNTENLKSIINKVLLLHPKRIYTDGLNMYPSIIPKEIHKRFQYCTNRIERMNLNLRTHIKRLSRKTICFTRNQKYLEAHLKIYFWG